MIKNNSFMSYSCFRISRFTCTWPNNLPNHSPKHCWDVARHLPRIETWVFQAWVTDVRQTQKTRSNTLDPCSSWCPWPYFLPWIHLQPSSYRNLRNLQSTSSKRSIVRTRLPRRTWRYKTLCSQDPNSFLSTLIVKYLQNSTNIWQYILYQHRNWIKMSIHH